MAEQQKQQADAPKADAPDAPKAESKSGAKKSAPAHPAPSEFKGIEKGINGGPATIDNPPKSAVLEDD